MMNLLACTVIFFISAGNVLRFFRYDEVFPFSFIYQGLAWLSLLGSLVFAVSVIQGIKKRKAA